MLQKKRAGDLRNPAAPLNWAQVGTSVDRGVPYEIGPLDGLARAPPPATWLKRLRRREK